MWNLDRHAIDQSTGSWDVRSRATLLSSEALGENVSESRFPLRHGSISFVTLTCLLVVLFMAGPRSAISSESSSSLEWKFSHDAEGRIEKLIDPAGRATSVTYRGCGKGAGCRIEKKLPGGEEIVYELDSIGRLVSMQDRGGVSRFSWKSRDRLGSFERSGMPAVRVTYDSLGRLSQVHVGDRLVAGYEYDFRGFAHRLNTEAGAVTYDYRSGKGELIRTLPNGVRSTFEYGPDGKVVKISHIGDKNNQLAIFEYSYGPDGRVSGVSEMQSGKKRRLRYTYDGSGRLVSVTDGQRSRQYQYDRLGNRTALINDKNKRKAQFDWANRIQTQGGERFAHDAVGNVSKKLPESGPDTAFTYDGSNRLTEVRRGGVAVSYRYDGNGNLTERRSAGKSRRFVPLPFGEFWKPLLAIDSDGTRRLFVWDGGLLASISPKGAEFYLEDLTGSVRLIVDSQGQVIAAPNYGPFGAMESTDGMPDFGPGFAGLFFDSQSGLYMTLSRSYDPATGRFLQRDPVIRVPVGSQHEMNAYAYCGNDPVNFVDRNGMSPVSTATDPVSSPLRRVATPDTRTQGGWEVRDIGPADRAEGSEVEPPRQRSGTQSRTRERTAEADSEQAKLLRQVILGLKLADVYKLLKKEKLTEVDIDLERLLKTKLKKKKRRRRAVIPYWREWYEPVRWTYFPLVDYWWSYPSYYTYNLGSYYRSASSYYSNFSSYYSSTYRYGSSYRYSMPVGGIWLSGAGNIIKGVGALRGIALDDHNGRLVLLGDEPGKKIDLGPLRLDDVVPIFRSVYYRGVGPWVSIEDDPKNPKGPCVPSYGPGMANTFVGWILYEADRVMKNYGSGIDNFTGKRMRSRIAGYDKLIDFHFRELARAPKSGRGRLTPVSSTRFWITPGSVTYRRDKNNRATLMDIPLKLNLEPIFSATGEKKPGKANIAFADWFTAHYSDVAQEWASAPREGPFRGKKFHVFSELKRLALLSAVAEQLRDRGVPMPSWMRDYEISPYPTPKRDPRRYNIREIGGYQLAVGGIGLSPEYRSVVGACRIRSVKNDPEANACSQKLSKALRINPAPETVKFPSGRRKFSAAVLPGPGTKDVGGCNLERVDLRVPMQGDHVLELTRFYKSFMSPKGELGASWTLDLPTLMVSAVKPASRMGRTVTFKQYHLLTSPLNSVDVMFMERKYVPALKGEFRVPKNSSEILALASSDKPKSTPGDTEVIFVDGRGWHFDKDGFLVAKCLRDVTHVYRRDAQHRVRKIEGWIGNILAAEVRLEYDGQGRIVKATAGDKGWVRYSYNDKGRLSRVKTPSKEESYSYDKSLLASVRSDGTTRRFVYDPYGRLIKETDEAGTILASYEIERTKAGTRLLCRSRNKDGSYETTVYRYDKGFRPTEETYADGRKVTYVRAEDGSTEQSVVTPEEYRLIISRTRGGEQTVRVASPDGVTYSVQQKPGREVSISEGDAGIGTVSRFRDGGLRRIENQSTAFRWSREKESLARRLLVTKPGEQKSYKRWVEFLLDNAGRTTKVADYKGHEINIAYDKIGKPTSVRTSAGEMKIARDSAGRPKQLTTSWGLAQKTAYDAATGRLKEMVVTADGKSATARFDELGVREYKDFDGARLSCAYVGEGAAKGQPRQIKTETGLILDYRYDARGRPESVNCGDLVQLRYTYDPKGRLASFAAIKKP